tara:strand:+ start:28 stop:201 length:174 start_codon:yes stop_codon:yes gene_type:complete
MKKILLFFIFFLSACVSNSDKQLYINDLTYSKNLSIDEFKTKLKEYAINKSYPNIDK